MFSSGIVLGIDAAGDVPCFSIARGNKILFVQKIVERHKTAAELISMLLISLDEIGIFPKEISRLCVTTGPGSFTGIRIALATVIGLNLGLGIPVASISTFNLWKWVFERKIKKVSCFDIIIVVLNSGGKDIYYAIFKPFKDKAYEVGMWSEDVLYSKISGFNTPCILGNVQRFSKEFIGKKKFFSYFNLMNPESIALWGSNLKTEDFYYYSLLPLEPFYLKIPEVLLKY